MKKANTTGKKEKIIYWIATVWLSFGMVFSGVIQILRLPAEVEFMTKLGYPIYFMTIIGVWKILGVMTILAPKYPLLKEWAYAGMFFLSTGAILSQLLAGDPIVASIGGVLLTVLTVVSWYFRPADRRISFTC